MKRANVVLLGFAVSMLLATNVVAHDASSGSLASLASLPQPAVSGATQAQSSTVTNIPLLVIVTNKAQVRNIQHAQRLPKDVNNLLWSSVQNWTKSPARVNGKRVTAQVFMDVVMHAESRADGNSNVYFTLASIGPVMRGYWKMRGDRINGPCSVTGNMVAGVGGTSERCTFKLTAGVAPTTAGAPSAK